MCVSSFVYCIVVPLFIAMIAGGCVCVCSNRIQNGRSQFISVKIG